MRSLRREPGVLGHVADLGGPVQDMVRNGADLGQSDADRTGWQKMHLATVVLRKVVGDHEFSGEAFL